MLKRVGGTFASLTRETRGSEIAEAALVLPLAFMMLLGVFWFGQAFSIYGTLTHAARQAARAAAAPVCTTCAPGSTTVGQNAYNAIQSAFAAAHLDPRKLSQPATIPVLSACNGGAAPTCDKNPTNVCVQEGVQLSSNTGPSAGVCGVSVSFQYPYQFWFPGTSLNKQLIQLQGVARMRMETR